MSTRRPRTSCGFIYHGLVKHYPHCTKAWRKSDGCECAMEYGHRSESPELRTVPTARQWRAQRRQAVRRWKVWQAEAKAKGWPF